MGFKPPAGFIVILKSITVLHVIRVVNVNRVSVYWHVTWSP